MILFELVCCWGFCCFCNFDVTKSSRFIMHDQIGLFFNAFHMFLLYASLYTFRCNNRWWLTSLQHGVLRAAPWLQFLLIWPRSPQMLFSWKLMWMKWRSSNFLTLFADCHDILYLLIALSVFWYLFSEQTIAEQFSVEAMPTFLFMREGDVKDRVVGAAKEELARKLELHMAS